MIKGYVCRSKNSDTICIATGSKLPEINFNGEETGWFWHIPGWFYQMKVRVFKKHFGFSVKPGTYKLITIDVKEAICQKRNTNC